MRFSICMTTFCTLLLCYNCKLESTHGNIAVGVEPPSSEHPTSTVTYTAVYDCLRAKTASLLYATVPIRRLRFWPPTSSADGIGTTKYASHHAMLQWVHLTVKRLDAEFAAASQSMCEHIFCGRGGIPRQRNPVAHACPCSNSNGCPDLA
jgi:hypothetical protein